ncbi:MAG: hypothetical protein P8Z30_05595 [Acidobacteriota bacterium]
MGRIWIGFVLLSLLSIPAYSQSVFVKGNNQAAKLAKADLRKDTGYKLGNNKDRTILEVRQETWSQTLQSQPTTAISMTLLTSKGRLLWSKTEPVGSRSAEAVIQDLLKQLAKAKPKIH